jgi:Transcription factor WhiB
MTAARVPTNTLTLALLGLAELGLRTHCSDPASHHLWLSERDAERATAVMLCDHCPILTVCRDTAEQRQETWGVWGGKDFSRRPGRKKVTTNGEP